MDTKPLNATQPVQKRAVKTINKLLDACAELLADKGYEGLNTNLVAELAGVNISTLYRYFPNKESLLESLLKRLNEQQISMVREKLANNPNRDDRVGQIIDALIAMMIAQPWMLAVKDAMNASPQLRELRNSSQQAMIDAVISQIPPDMGGPKVSGKQQQAVLRLLLEMFGNGVQLAVNSPKKERPAIVKEVKQMINSYLDNYR
jgi:AcrR family transcriptional regulator